MLYNHDWLSDLIWYWVTVFNCGNRWLFVVIQYRKSEFNWNQTQLYFDFSAQTVSGRTIRILSGILSETIRIVSGHSTDSLRTLSGYCPGHWRHYLDTGWILSGQSPDSIRTLLDTVGHSLDSVWYHIHCYHCFKCINEMIQIQTQLKLFLESIKHLCKLLSWICTPSRQLEPIQFVYCPRSD